MKPAGAEGGKTRGWMLTPYPSCDFQLLAWRCCWRCLLCVTDKHWFFFNNQHLIKWVSFLPVSLDMATHQGRNVLQARLIGTFFIYYKRFKCLTEFLWGCFHSWNSVRTYKQRRGGKKGSLDEQTLFPITPVSTVCPGTHYDLKKNMGHVYGLSVLRLRRSTGAFTDARTWTQTLSAFA